MAFVLLNVPFWWLGQTSFLHRAWLNVDLFLPLIVASVSPVAACASLLLLWILDMAVSQSLTWHFHSPFEFIRSIEFVPAIDVAGYVTLSRIAMAIPFLGCGVAAIWLVRRRPRVYLSVLPLLLTVALVDGLNGSSFLWKRATRFLPGNVAGSATKVSINSMLSSATDELKILPPNTALTEQFDVISWAKSHPDRGVLLVLVESMGLHNDPRMRHWIRDQLVDETISAQFRVDDFSVPFKGSTTSAELRELCHLDGSYRALSDRDNSSCLPNELGALGWETVGLHGFSHRMFMRGEWWFSTGLQRRLFAEELAAPAQVLCGGAFVGICDDVVMRRSVREAEGARRFVYALTLNGHLPLPTAIVPGRLRSVCGESGAGEGVCDLTAVNGVALRGLREALKTSGHQPLVLVVGDHSPPFGDLQSRQQYSQTSVPGFVLVPRCCISGQQL